jgi:hypothetical protein
VSVEFILYVAVGKLIIYLLQKFLSDAQFLKILVSCDLCVGVWVYTILSGLFQIRLLEDVYFYVPLVTEFITGCVVSYAVHLLSIGFREKHLPVII